MSGGFGVQCAESEGDGDSYQHYVEGDVMLAQHAREIVAAGYFSSYGLGFRHYDRRRGGGLFDRNYFRDDYGSFDVPFNGRSQVLRRSQGGIGEIFGQGFAAVGAALARLDDWSAVGG